MLVVNEHLQHLDLSWNVIKPVGGHALGAGLSDNTHLHTLNVCPQYPGGCSKLSEFARIG